MTLSVEPLKTESDSSRPLPSSVRLWAAVIRRAAADYTLNLTHENERLRAYGVDAKAWVFSGENQQDVNSFETVCSYLGLDPGVVRDRMSRQSKAAVSKLRGMDFGDD
jgi:hypothetical protein